MIRSFVCRLIIRYPAESIFIQSPRIIFGRKLLYGLCYDKGSFAHVVVTADVFWTQACITTVNKLLTAKILNDLLLDITTLPDDDTDLYYKDEPYTPKTLHQRLIITYSPKYARYQKAIRDAQVERAEKMISSGEKVKKQEGRHRHPWTCPSG